MGGGGLGPNIKNKNIILYVFAMKNLNCRLKLKLQHILNIVCTIHPQLCCREKKSAGTWMTIFAGLDLGEELDDVHVDLTHCHPPHWRLKYIISFKIVSYIAN